MIFDFKLAAAPGRESRSWNPPKGKSVISPDARALWCRSGGTFWMSTEVEPAGNPAEEHPSLHLFLDADGPTPAWWEWVNEELIDYMFNGNIRDDEVLVLELMKLGIAPGQAFKVDMTFMTSGPYSGDGWDEYDYEVDWEVLEIEAWTPAQVLAAWELWFQGSFLPRL